MREESETFKYEISYCQNLAVIMIKYVQIDFYFSLAR